MYSLLRFSSEACLMEVGAVRDSGSAEIRRDRPPFLRCWSGTMSHRRDAKRARRVRAKLQVEQFDGRWLTSSGRSPSRAVMPLLANRGLEEHGSPARCVVAVYCRRAPIGRIPVTPSPPAFSSLRGVRLFGSDPLIEGPDRKNIALPQRRVGRIDRSVGRSACARRSDRPKPFSPSDSGLYPGPYWGLLGTAPGAFSRVA
jgi:hypothetical protein